LLGEEMFEVSVKNMQNDHQYLVALHEKESAMHVQTHFSNMMMFAPLGTNSMTHRKLTMAIANKHKKHVRTKVYAKLHDPELLKREAEKVTK
jgi:RNA polymerase-associated protein LEO1